MKRRITVLLALGMLPCAGLYAQALSTTATFKVSASVQAVCTVTATDLTFGAYTGQSDLLGETALTAICTPQQNYQIGLNGGVAGDINKRQMKSGATNALGYQLYSDTSRTIIWGNTQNTDTVTGTPGTGTAQPYPIYGKVPLGQKVAAGTYEDTIIVTIYY